MHFFELKNFQHFVLYLFPSFAFVLLFAAGLAYIHIHRKDSEERKKRIIEAYPGGIEGRNAPFPLVLYLIIGGAVLWALYYIVVFIGLLGAKI
jgi:hypothetical protein